MSKLRSNELCISCRSLKRSEQGEACDEDADDDPEELENMGGSD